MSAKNAPKENPKERPSTGADAEKKIVAPKTLNDLKAEFMPDRSQEMLAARTEVIVNTDDKLVALARRIEKENPPERRYESILAA